MDSAASKLDLTLTIPAFVDELVTASAPLIDETSAMQLAIRLSHENVRRGGAPFGAVVCSGNRVIRAGVNRVLDTGFSIAHAEIVAMMRAQQALRTGVVADEALTLFTSTEPCCQCFGAVVWAGISRLVCGASTLDAEAIGFDEGPKPSAWVGELERRGLSVRLELCRDEARQVLDEYKARGGPIFGTLTSSR